MKDENLTKKQLIDELAILRQQNAELEKVEAKHKKAEGELQEKEQTLRSLLNAPTESAMLVDTEGKILSLNEVSANRLGKNIDELIGLRMSDYLPLDIAKSRKTIGNKVIRSGKPIRFQDERAGKFFDNNIYPVFDVKGKVKALAVYARDITDRKQAEEEIIKAKTYLENSFACSPDGVLLLDKEGRFSYVNAAVLKWLGRRAEDFLGKTVLEVSPPIMAPEMTKIIGDRTRKRLKTGEPIVEAEIEIIDNYGKKKPISYSASGIKDDKGKILGEVVFLRDITDRKQAEEKLRAERDFNKKLIDTSPTFFAVIDSQGKIVTMNNSMLRTLGYSESEVQGVDYLSTFVPEQDREQLSQVFQKLIISRKPTLVENHVLTKDGRMLLVEWHGCPITNPKGEVDYFFGVGIDITERKRYEKELRESEQRYRSIVETAGSVIINLSPDYRIIEFNTEAEKLYGCKREDVLEKNYFELFLPEEVHVAVAADMKKVLTGEASKGFENVVRAHDGCERIISWNVSRLLDSEGQPMGITAIGRDITERKRAEMALQEREQRYRTLFEGANDAIFIMERNKFIECNNMTLSMYGCKKKEDIIGHPPWDFSPPQQSDGSNSKKKALKLINAALDGKPQRFYWKHIKKNGEPFDAAVSLNLLEIEEKTFIQAIVRNISKQMQSEEALKESEERFKILFEYAPDAYYLSDIKGNFIDGNKAAEDLIGSKKDELIGKSFLKLKLLSRKDIPRASALLAKNVLGKPTGPDEFVLKRKDNTHVVAEISTYPVKIRGNTLVLSIARDITERKKAQDELKASEEKFQKAFHKNANPMMLAELDTRTILDVNEAYTRLLGYTAKEIVNIPGRLGFTVISPEKYRQGLEFWGKENSLSGFEVESMTKNGEHLIGLVSAEAVFIQKKKLFIISMTDITERKRAEKALRESEETLRAIIENSNDWIWSINSEGNHTYSNPAVEEILGYSPDELLGKSSLDLMHPKEKREIEVKLTQWIDEKQGWQNLVIRWQHKDGSWRWLESNAVPIFDPEGTLTGFTGVDRDITERKQIEKALRESEARFRVLSEAAFEGIVVSDKGHILDVNNQFSHMFGYKKPELIGMSAFNLVAPESRELVKKNIESGYEEPYEHQALRKDGTVITVEVTGKSIPYKGRLVRVTAIRDITERKKAEKEIQNYQEKLRSLASRLSLTEEKERRHIATFIHDQISQKLALAKMEFGAMSQSLSAAEQHKPAKRIRDLIDETIQDTRTLTFELSPPILYELGLEQSIGWLLEQFGEKHDIQFLFKDDGKPKPMDDDIRTILFQSVRELLTNTIKHSQAKEVKVSTYREENKIQLTVEDDGIGFDPSKVKPYSVKTGGFGLFNIRERLEDFYGIMDIKSKKGQGTRVTLIAPLSIKKAPEIRK